MRTAEKTLNLLWIVLGLAVAGWSPRYVLFDVAGPGGGFLPFLAGIILSTCGCVLLGNASADSSAYWPRGSVLLRMGTVLVGLFGNPVLTGTANCPTLVVPTSCPEVAVASRPSRGKETLVRAGAAISSLTQVFRGGLADVAAVRALCPLPDTAHELKCVAKCQTARNLDPPYCLTEECYRSRRSACADGL
jgi:hypothetical protein